MSVYMLDDKKLMNDINPFVMCDFSLPGGVRKTGNFQDFSKEIQPVKNVWTEEKSPYCDFGLCRDEVEPLVLERGVHPRRNIDTGFTCMEPRVRARTDTPVMTNGSMLMSLVLLTVLILFVARR